MIINKNVEVIDELKNTLSEIEEWSEQNKIQIAHCVLFDREGLPAALWQGRVDWKGFLETAKRIGNDIIWITVNRGNFPNEDRLNALFEFADEDEKESIINAKKFEGKIVSIDIYWVYRGVLNTLAEEADWVDEYFDYEEIVRDLSSRVQDYIIQGTMQEKAEKLLQHPKYSDCKNRTDRGYLAQQMFGLTSNYRQIAELAETIKKLG